MKRVIKYVFVSAICMAVTHCYGQSPGINHSSRTINQPGTSVAISIKNPGDNSVIIYAGPRDELASPKSRQKVYGGQSTNTIYASVNEVVCIIGQDEKPVSCVDVMPGIEELEIDNAGKVISIK